MINRKFMNIWSDEVRNEVGLGWGVRWGVGGGGQTGVG